ncbi:phage antirepressor KilAC domain-containing protein, partial [Endozoicomonas sp. SM1973]
KAGEPWFVAKDIAEALEYPTAYKMTRSLDADEKDAQIVGTLGGNQEVTVINESGLYSAILKSRKPEAKTFKKWVKKEVLPSIRKNGGYIAGQENDSPEMVMAKALLVVNSIIEDKTKQIEEALPKVEFYDKVTHATDAISVGKSAKILNTGRNRLMSYLRRHEWVNSDNEPYQVMIELGYMDVKLGK